MEKVKRNTILVEATKHIFYCDGCKKNLGSSDEYDDGYYEERGEFNLNAYIPAFGWFRIKKHFCDECNKQFQAKVANALIDLGFENK